MYHRDTLTYSADGALERAEYTVRSSLEAWYLRRAENQKRLVRRDPWSRQGQLVFDWTKKVDIISGCAKAQPIYHEKIPDKKKRIPGNVAAGKEKIIEFLEASS